MNLLNPNFNLLDLLLPLNPADICTAQQKGERVIGKWVQHYTKPEVRRSKAEIRKALWQAAGKRGIPMIVKRKKIDGSVIDCPCFPHPLKQAVKVEIKFNYKVKRAHKFDECYFWRTKRADLDNLAKSFLDCLTDMELWHDDAQVSVLNLQKRETSYNPYIYLTLHEMDDTEPI